MKSSFTHQTDSCRFTVSNYGTYGLADESITNKGGVGFTFPADGTNNLFQCGLMIGADSNHVSDGVVNKLGSVDEDFAVVPGGNLTHYIDGVIGDVETFCRFADDRAANPLGIVVEQRTASFTNALTRGMSSSNMSFPTSRRRLLMARMSVSTVTGTSLGEPADRTAPAFRESMALAIYTRTDRWPTASEAQPF